MWFLGWIPHAIAHGTNPLFSTAINYPYGVNLMWNTSSPLLAILSWPIATLFGPVLNYNLLLTSSVAATGFAAFKVFGRYVTNPVAALAGALLLEVSPYLAAHAVDHLLLVVAIFPVIAIVLVDEALVRQRHAAWKLGAMAGLLAAAQFYISQEILVITVLAMGIAGLWLAGMNRSEVARRFRYFATSLGFAALTMLPLIAWPLWFQLFGPQRIIGPTQPANYFVSDLTNFFLPTEIQSASVGGIGRMFTGGIVEASAYVGLPVLAITGFMVWKYRRDKLIATTGALLATLVILSMGPYLHFLGNSTGIPLPWTLVSGLPVINALLPVRLSLLFDVLAAFLVAVFFDRIRLKPRVVLAVGVLTVASWLPTLPFPAQPAPAAAYFQNAAKQLPNSSVLLILPLARYDSTAMYWQLRSDFSFSMPEGYFFSPLPDGTAHTGVSLNVLTQPLQEIQDHGFTSHSGDRVAILAELAREKVDLVVVGPMANQSQELQFLSNLFGCPGTSTQDVVLWHAGKPCS
jgi:hypothetical protein